MRKLLAAAEIEKLARLLGEPPERFGYLEALPADDLRRARGAITDFLFDADRHVFERLAAGAAIVPDGLAATLARKAFGAFLTARMTGVVDPGKAVAVARRLPHEFLADVAVELDPRRAAAVLQGLPTDHVAATSRELVRRGEWVAMGRFVAHLTDEAIQAVLQDLDDEALLRIAFVIEDPDEVPRVAEWLSEERIARLVRVAAEHGLEAQAKPLIERMG